MLPGRRAFRQPCSLPLTPVPAPFIRSSPRHTLPVQAAGSAVSKAQCGHTHRCPAGRRAGGGKPESVRGAGGQASEGTPGGRGGGHSRQRNSKDKGPAPRGSVRLAVPSPKVDYFSCRRARSTCPRAQRLLRIQGAPRSPGCGECRAGVAGTDQHPHSRFHFQFSHWSHVNLSHLTIAAPCSPVRVAKQLTKQQLGLMLR